MVSRLCLVSLYILTEYPWLTILRLILVTERSFEASSCCSPTSRWPRLKGGEKRVRVGPCGSRWLANAVFAWLKMAQIHMPIPRRHWWTLPGPPCAWGSCRTLASCAVWAAPAITWDIINWLGDFRLVTRPSDADVPLCRCLGAPDDWNDTRTLQGLREPSMNPS